MQTFAEQSPILRVLPFETITGSAISYTREQILPGVAFRGVNEGYPSSTGVVNPITETLAILGGDLDVDTAIIKTRGEAVRTQQERMKAKAISHRWGLTFFKGDSGRDPREFDGLQKRIIGAQLIPNGVSNTVGLPLSLFSLDALIANVSSPTYLIMNTQMTLRLTQAARTPSVAGYITYGVDEFGRRNMSYAGIPILDLNRDDAGLDPLPFTEAGPSGGSTCTSIYCVSFADGQLTGIQNGTMEVRDLGELQEKPAVRTRVEWLAGIACYTGRCASRLYGITDALVVP
jgi:hypothetical protein